MSMKVETIGVAVLLLSSVVLAGKEQRDRLPARADDMGSQIEEAVAESLNAQLEALGGSAAEFYESLLEAMIAHLDGGAFSHVGQRAPCASSSREDAPCALTGVRTKGGLLYVVDFGDGLVHLLVFTLERGETHLGDLSGLALNVAIGAEGVEVVEIDEEQLARFVATGGQDSGSPPSERAEGRDSAGARGLPLDEERLNAQLEALSEFEEPVSFKLLRNQASEVYKIFQAAIAHGEDTGIPQWETSQTDEASSTEESSSPLRGVRTKGGMVYVVDWGDGAVHILLFPLDQGKAHLKVEDMDGLALKAAITAGGFEIAQIDGDRLARFVGSGEYAELGATAAARDMGGDTGGSRLDVAIDCNWTRQKVCCVVATVSRFCICCAGLNPLTVGCVCFDLQ